MLNFFKTNKLWFTQKEMSWIAMWLMLKNQNKKQNSWQLLSTLWNVLHARVHAHTRTKRWPSWAVVAAKKKKDILTNWIIYPNFFIMFWTTLHITNYICKVIVKQITLQKVFIKLQGQVNCCLSFTNWGISALLLK